MEDETNNHHFSKDRVVDQLTKDLELLKSDLDTQSISPPSVEVVSVGREDLSNIVFKSMFTKMIPLLVIYVIMILMGLYLSRTFEIDFVSIIIFLGIIFSFIFAYIFMFSEGGVLQSIQDLDRYKSHLRIHYDQDSKYSEQQLHLFDRLFRAYSTYLGELGFQTDKELTRISNFSTYEYNHDDFDVVFTLSKTDISFNLFMTGKEEQTKYLLEMHKNILTDGVQIEENVNDKAQDTKNETTPVQPIQPVKWRVDRDKLKISNKPPETGLSALIHEKFYFVYILLSTFLILLGLMPLFLDTVELAIGLGVFFLVFSSSALLSSNRFVFVVPFKQKLMIEFIPRIRENYEMLQMYFLLRKRLASLFDQQYLQFRTHPAKYNTTMYWPNFGLIANSHNHIEDGNQAIAFDRKSLVLTITGRKRDIHRLFDEIVALFSETWDLHNQEAVLKKLYPQEFATSQKLAETTYDKKMQEISQEEAKGLMNQKNSGKFILGYFLIMLLVGAIVVLIITQPTPGLSGTDYVVYQDSQSKHLEGTFQLEKLTRYSLHIEIDGAAPISYSADIYHNGDLTDSFSFSSSNSHHERYQDYWLEQDTTLSFNITSNSVISITLYKSLTFPLSQILGILILGVFVTLSLIGMLFAPTVPKEEQEYSTELIELFDLPKNSSQEVENPIGWKNLVGFVIVGILLWTVVIGIIIQIEAVFPYRIGGFRYLDFDLMFGPVLLLWALFTLSLQYITTILEMNANTKKVSVGFMLILNIAAVAVLFPGVVDYIVLNIG